jgi:hypothetical protein
MRPETVQQPTWDGRPASPERSGWHWIEDGDGVRPLLWRGNDWPEPLDRGEWQDGFAVVSPHTISYGRYHGPLAMPPTVATLFSLRLLTRSI